MTNFSGCNKNCCSRCCRRWNKLGRRWLFCWRSDSSRGGRNRCSGVDGDELCTARLERPAVRRDIWLCRCCGDRTFFQWHKLTLRRPDKKMKRGTGTLGGMRKSIYCLTFGVMLCTVTAGAQESGGATINGTVTDPSGGLISGAKITATQPATGTRRTTQTSSAGLYTISPLPVGNYYVTVESTRFKQPKFA